MTIALQDETPKLVKDLADAFSRQSNYSNRLWLALIVAAAVVLFPNIDGKVIRLMIFQLFRRLLGRRRYLIC